MKNQISIDVSKLVTLINKHSEWSATGKHDFVINHKSGLALKVYASVNHSEGGFEVSLNEDMDFLTMAERLVLTTAIQELLFVLSHIDRAKFFEQVWRFVDKQAL